MAVMDEFKEERAKVKEMPLRDRIDHFVYYHKVGIMMTVLIAIIAISGIHDFLTSKDTAVYVALIDCLKIDYKGENEKDYQAILTEQLGINTDTHTVILDDTYVLSAVQYAADESVYQLPEILYTRFAAGEFDAFVAQESTINGWVMNDGFLDLRDQMTPEQYEYYEDSFYWIDYALLEDYELDFDKGAYVYDEDHRSPEGMKDPMPVGVYVTPCEEFQEYYNFLYDQEVVYCLTYSKQDKKDEYNGTQKALELLDIWSGRTQPVTE